MNLKVIFPQITILMSVVIYMEQKKQFLDKMQVSNIPITNDTLIAMEYLIKFDEKDTIFILSILKKLLSIGIPEYIDTLIQNDINIFEFWWDEQSNVDIDGLFQDLDDEKKSNMLIYLKNAQKKFHV